DGDYTALTLESPHDLRGYGVIKIFEREGRRRGKIVDLLTSPNDTQAMQSLLVEALREMRRQGVERAECFQTGARPGETFTRLGFRPRLSKTGRPQPLMTRHLPAEAQGIYVTQGDGDGG
ncbi:MAG: hypothetical protein WAK53_04395, partial [Chromatiaceae bacterium]